MPVWFRRWPLQYPCATVLEANRCAPKTKETNHSAFLSPLDAPAPRLALDTSAQTKIDGSLSNPSRPPVKIVPLGALRGGYLQRFVGLILPNYRTRQRSHLPPIPQRSAAKPHAGADNNSNLDILHLPLQNSGSTRADPPIHRLKKARRATHHANHDCYRRCHRPRRPPALRRWQSQTILNHAGGYNPPMRNATLR